MVHENVKEYIFVYGMRVTLLNVHHALLWCFVTCEMSMCDRFPATRI